VLFSGEKENTGAKETMNSQQFKPPFSKPITILSEVNFPSGYHQLVCAICKKPLMELDWCHDREGKTVHVKCDLRRDKN